MSIVTKSGAIACATLLAAAANAGERYVLTASNWGKLQEAHVAAAGGKALFANANAGVAIVESANPQFLSQVLAGGAIQTGAVDAEFAWTVPARTFDLDANAVNPADDRFFNTIQWAPQAVNAPQAWAAGYTGKGVRVAVIDGGIFGTHPDLTANVDAVAARSFVAIDPAATPAVNACRTAWNCDTGTLWHGTHVAGIVAAADNSIGVVGIAPEPLLALADSAGAALADPTAYVEAVLGR